MKPNPFEVRLEDEILSMRAAPWLNPFERAVLQEFEYFLADEPRRTEDFARQLFREQFGTAPLHPSKLP